jgi:hypothetical protein
MKKKKKKQNRYSTIILKDESFVPAGCVQIRDLNGEKSEKGALRMAIRDGRVQGYKIAASFADLVSGPTYVNEHEAEKYFYSYRKWKAEPEREPKSRKPEPPPPKVAENARVELVEREDQLIAIERVLLRIEALLEEHITRSQTKLESLPQQNSVDVAV